jgi:hypothetical protein
MKILKAIKWAIFDSGLFEDLFLCATLSFGTGFVSALILYMLAQFVIDFLGAVISDRVLNTLLAYGFFIPFVLTFCLMFYVTVVGMIEDYKVYKQVRGL